MKYIAKRSFSLLLVLAMLVSLFAGLTMTASAAGETYDLFTESAIAPGNYIIVDSNTNKAMSNKVESNWITCSTNTYTGNSVTTSEAIVWTVAADGTISCAGGNLYASAAKKIALSTTSSTKWTFTNDNGIWTIKNASVGQLSLNGTSGWRPYSGGYGDNKTFRLYKLAGSVTPGTTCEHENTEVRDAVAATCTAAGYTGDTYCTDCGEKLTTGTVITALGHNYVDGFCTNCHEAEPEVAPGWYLVKDYSDLQPGVYALLTSDNKAFNGAISSGHGQVTSAAFTFTDGYSATAPDGICELTFEGDNTAFTVYNADKGYLYAKAASSGNLAWDSTAKGTWKYNSNSLYSNNKAYLRSYNNASFRTYASTGNGSNMKLAYKVEGASATCEHTNAYDVAATPATCLETGLTAGRYCPDCETWLEGHEETAALGHAWDEGTVTTPATATEPGEMLYTCTRCDATKTEVIAPTDKVAYNRATEITSGDEYILVVKYDNKYYAVSGFASKALTVSEVELTNNAIIMERSDAYLIKIETVSDGYSLKADGKYISAASGNTDISQAATATAWTAAAGSADNSFRFSVGTSRALGMNSAGGALKHYSLVNTTGYEFDCYLFSNSCAHSHTELQNAVAADCSTSTNGYSGDLVCLDCGAVLEPGHTISGAHVYVVDHSTPATCTEPGTVYEVCSGCGKTRETEIAALGHNYEKTAHQDATCTVDGYDRYTCANCSDTYDDVIKALGHNYDPETGICSRCDNQLASYTVSFVVPDGIDPIDDITAFDGTKITLPEPTGTLAANAEEYIFAGWTTANVTDSTDADFLDAGEYTVTGDITFKALYAWVGSESFGGDSLYKLMTEDDLASLDTGWMLIIANDGKWQSKTMALADYTSGGNEKFAGRTVTVTNNTIKISATSDVQEFTVIKDEDTGFFYLLSNYTDADDTYYYLTSCTNTANANNITLTSNPTAAALWDISYHDDGTVKLTAQGSWTANTVQFNSSNYNGFFSCYGEIYYGNAPTNIYGIRLFASNAIYHFTTEPVQTCEHENVTWTDNEDGTCTGSCDDCGHTVADHQSHAWEPDEDAEGTVAATCTAGGKAGYVCANCAATELRDTEALGHDYVGVETAAPTCSAAGVMTYTCSRCEDSYEEEIPAVSHNFVNGTCDMCGASLYVLVTEAPANWEGEYLIAYVNGENAKVFDGKHDAAANYTIGTFYGEEGSESSLICVPNPDDYTMFFDPNTDGTYGIMNSDTDWWSYKDAKNGFSVSASTSFAGKYTISLDASGNAVIKNAGNYSIKFNNGAAASGGDRFRFYGTSVYTTVKLYEKYDTCHHDWVLDEDASTPASCGVAGNNVYECSVCHETKNETVPALQHDYWYVDVPATCLEEGYTECYCHNCDYAEILDYTITEPLGHDFSKLVEDEDHYIAPTCTEPGLAVYQCSRCDAFDTETSVVEPLGHDYVNGICSRCGDELDGQTYTLMTSLDFSDAGSVIMVIKYEDEYYALSEDKDGKYLVCKPVTVTNNTITVYDDGTYAIMMPFTNVNDGGNTGYGFETAERNYLHVNSKAVEFAHETTNAALAITQAEVWNGEWDSHDNPIMKKVPNAWFLQSMATGKYISNYIDTYEDTELSVIDDSWFAVPIYFFASDYTKPIEPEPSTHNLFHFEGYPATCTDEGYAEYYTCLDNDCECAGKMYADPYCTIEITDLTIPALGHDYRWDGDMGDGTHFMVCSRCEDFYLEDCDHDGENGCCSVCGYGAETPIEPTVKINSAALRLGENIDLLYTATVPADATNVYMTFTMNGETVTVNADGTGILAFTDITPQCMGDNIAAVLYATVNGKVYTDELAEYSVKQYCVNTLAKTEDAKLISLLSDVLAYGAAAQNYMSYKTDALVTADVEGASYSTYTDLSGLNASFTGTAADNLCWVGAGLKLNDDVAMFFRFYAEDINGLSVKVAINGREETFAEFTALGDDLYEVSFNGIKATEFGAAVTASFYRSNAQVGNTVSYSVNTYVCAKQADSNANLAALVKALYNYGASANAYAK